MKETGQQFWNSKASSWERFGDLTPSVEGYIQEKVSKYFTENNDDFILNLGSGSCKYNLDKFGKAVINLDFARNMLIANGNECQIEADARKSFPFEDESMGNICSFFLMRYLNKRQQSRFLSESARVLKKNGCLVILDIPDNNHSFQVEKFKPEKFVRKLESLGLEAIECKTSRKEVEKYISTGFGGYTQTATYPLGEIVAKKVT